MRRTFGSRPPREWLISGSWPDGEFDPDAPEVLAHAVAVSVALAAALKGRNKSEVAQAADIRRSTLYDILAGNTWADMVTLAKLESCLGTALWPREPAPELRRPTG
ncbi:helix-turn-helix transcriptional regulator [Aeromicrobium sp. 9AM]|uniref:helix-turn-helix domain-containing protein n=1 Tax=Aeromicrobium sp. 9AM TaxID=2653126 RepID=UPI0012F114CB|nr:conserved hypothetical protein [Aeromicrobium sp. 9AM]